MDVEKFLNSLDNLFEKKKINEVPAFLEENYKEAVRENDLSAQFTILNEMMGFFILVSMRNPLRHVINALTLCRKWEYREVSIMQLPFKILPMPTEQQDC